MRINFGSLHADAMNVIPTGKSNTSPAVTLTSG